MKVALVDSTHDYNSALYGAMPGGAVEVHDIRPGQPPESISPSALVGDSRVLHIGWPEYLFRPPEGNQEAHDRSVLEFIQRLGASPLKVVWTMHNRRPHYPQWRGKRGDDLYRAWAAIADGVIHHSEWGMQFMRQDLAYKKEAVHAVIPHGHFGEQMPAPAPREELERRFRLPPTSIRFGVLGRPQKEKQVDMMVKAFMKAARPDQQLLVTAHPIDTDVSTDPRVILLPREDWLTRETIASHVHLCDALVSAHVGETYLTSGTIADAIGAGIPMIVNDWEFFREMLGDAAVYHSNEEDGLAAVFEKISAEEIDRRKGMFQALQPAFSWPAVAGQTLKLLREI